LYGLQFLYGFDLEILCTVFNLENAPGAVLKREGSGKALSSDWLWRLGRVSVVPMWEFFRAFPFCPDRRLGSEVFRFHGVDALGRLWPAT
jgi:hypothetical protein